MSFSTKQGEPLSIVKGGKANKEIIFVSDKLESDTCIRLVPTKKIDCHDGSFEQLPSPKVRILYIAGPSGSGKSTYAASYIKKYINLFIKPFEEKMAKEVAKGVEGAEERAMFGPKFYLFSRIDSDPVLDALNPIRVKCDASIISNPFDIKEIEANSILLFDDIDCITSPKVQAVVNNLKEQVMDLGRHMNINCVITSHLINGKDRNASRTTLNELNSLTIFPKSGSAYQIKYALKQYFGLSPSQIGKILAIDSRWVTLIKSYPQVCLSEHQCIFVSELEGLPRPLKALKAQPILPK